MCWFLGPSPVLLESWPEQSWLYLWLEMCSLRFPWAVLVVYILNGGHWSTLNCCFSRMRVAGLISFCCVAYPVLPGPCIKQSFSPCASDAFVWAKFWESLDISAPHHSVPLMWLHTGLHLCLVLSSSESGLASWLPRLLSLTSPHCLLLRQQKSRSWLFPMIKSLLFSSWQSWKSLSSIKVLLSPHICRSWRTTCRSISPPSCWSQP